MLNQHWLTLITYESIKVNISVIEFRVFQLSIRSTFTCMYICIVTKFSYKQKADKICIIQTVGNMK